MIDGVFVHPRALGDHFFDLAFDRAQKTRRGGPQSMSRIIRENAAEVRIEISGPLEFVLLLLATVMFAQGDANFGQCFYFSPGTVLGTSAGDLVHDFVDVFNFPQRRPAAITPAPVRTRLQPNGERFGEVLSRVRLRVPRLEVEYVSAAVWLGPIRFGIALREGAECQPPSSLEVQTKRIVDRMAGFVTQDAHALEISAAFNFEHLLAFEFRQPRMRQIKWNRKTRHAVGRKPVG